jgi:hypothetical protein
MNTIKLEAELSRMIAKGWDDPWHESNFWYVRANRILEGRRTCINRCTHLLGDAQA